MQNAMEMKAKRGWLDRFLGNEPELDAACVCDKGLKRSNNEDNYYFAGRYLSRDNDGLEGCLSDQTPLPEDAFFAVYDGMGGGDYGEVASYTAAAETESFLGQTDNINPCDITPSLTRMCLHINEKVFQTGKSLGVHQMGSTLVSLFFHEDQVWVCNLGDSRAFLCRGQKTRQISVDHTDEAEMKANGITNRKPYLTQFLGIDPEELRIEPFIQSGYYQAGDRYLLCSDGLTDMVDQAVIGEVLIQHEYPEECAEKLKQLALENGGRDNITVIVIDVY